MLRATLSAKGSWHTSKECKEISDVMREAETVAKKVDGLEAAQRELTQGFESIKETTQRGEWYLTTAIGTFKDLAALMEAALSQFGAESAGKAITAIEKRCKELDEALRYQREYQEHTERQLRLQQSANEHRKTLIALERARGDALNQSLEAALFEIDNMRNLQYWSVSYLKSVMEERARWQETHGLNPAHLQESISFVSAAQKSIEFLNGELGADSQVASVRPGDSRRSVADRFLTRLEFHHINQSQTPSYITPREELALLKELLEATSENSKQFSDRLDQISSTMELEKQRRQRLVSSFATTTEGKLQAIRVALDNLRETAKLAVQFNKASIYETGVLLERKIIEVGAAQEAQFKKELALAIARTRRQSTHPGATDDDPSKTARGRRLSVRPPNSLNASFGGTSAALALNASFSGFHPVPPAAAVRNSDPQSMRAPSPSIQQHAADLHNPHKSMKHEVSPARKPSPVPVTVGLTSIETILPTTQSLSRRPSDSSLPSAVGVNFELGTLSDVPLAVLTGATPSSHSDSHRSSAVEGKQSDHGTGQVAVDPASALNNFEFWNSRDSTQHNNQADFRSNDDQPLPLDGRTSGEGRSETRSETSSSGAGPFTVSDPTHHFPLQFQIPDVLPSMEGFRSSKLPPNLAFSRPGPRPSASRDERPKPLQAHMHQFVPLFDAVEDPHLQHPVEILARRERKVDRMNQKVKSALEKADLLTQKVNALEAKHGTYMEGVRSMQLPNVEVLKELPIPPPDTTPMTTGTKRTVQELMASASQKNHARVFSAGPVRHFHGPHNLEVFAARPGTANSKERSVPGEAEFQQWVRTRPL